MVNNLGLKKLKKKSLLNMYMYFFLTHKKDSSSQLYIYIYIVNSH